MIRRWLLAKLTHGAVEYDPAADAVYIRTRCIDQTLIARTTELRSPLVSIDWNGQADVVGLEVLL